VADASEYDAVLDRQQGDTEAYEGCLDFVKKITLNSAVRKLHVHGRLALLGDFEPEDSQAPSSLWVPGEAVEKSRKVDHKRVQYRAKQKSRLATIKNRSVPPLRPGVVNQLAEALPHLEFVTNGGVDSMEDIQDRLDAAPSNVVGCMIGRAAINHPCSFGLADTLWGDEILHAPTRGEVLATFADYCAMEEERLRALGRPGSFMEALRRRLVAVPFTLFVGEEGNNVFQRRIRKLISRPDRHTARSILLAAMAEMPVESLNRPVTEHSLEMESYTEYNQRSGPLQRAIL
jgi:tRNA-dihydrouridine synthase